MIVQLYHSIASQAAIWWAICAGWQINHPFYIAHARADTVQFARSTGRL